VTGAQAKPYHEPQPDPGVMHNQMTERAGVAQSRYAFARRWLIGPSLVAGFLLLLVAGTRTTPTGTARPP
jgi:hypothetical protein